MKLTGDEIQILNTINSFRKDYHNDFFIVRDISKKYLSDSNLCSSTITSLARALRRVLINWGAGGRKAPQPRDVKEIELALHEPKLHADLLSFAQIKISRLGTSEMNRLINMQRPTPTELKSIDEKLLSVLNCIAEKLFIDNSNVTYPMKALLLIAAYMPAFDGNVRRGLNRGGYQGFSSTQFILPKSTYSSNSKKITSMPYILGQCWNDYHGICTEAIRKSNYPSLLEEPARVFDILLFMQANNNWPIMLEHSGGNGAWYELN